MKFVVTGGAGFVGSHLVKLLIGEGHSVIVIDNLYNGTKENLKSVIDKIEFHKIVILFDVMLPSIFFIKETMLFICS